MLGADSLRQLAESGAVGDSCCHFVDAEGRLVAGFEERTGGISSDQIRRVPMRIAVAYGRPKLLATHAALRSGLVNAFATDDDTAAALLALDMHAGQWSL